MISESNDIFIYTEKESFQQIFHDCIPAFSIPYDRLTTGSQKDMLKAFIKMYHKENTEPALSMHYSTFGNGLA